MILFSILGIAVVLTTLPTSDLKYSVALLVLAEIAAPSLTELVARIEQSQRNGTGFGAILSGLSIARALAALFFIFAGNIDLGYWMSLYAVANLLFCTATLIWLFNNREIKKPVQLQWKLLKEGLPFAIGSVSIRLQGEFNKPVLAAISFALAGNLNIAQRVIDVVSLPLIALQETLWPRFYANSNPLHQMRIIFVAFLIMGLGMGAVLSLTAPLLPVILGESYETSSSMLIWLAWLPAIQIVRNFFNAALIARGQQTRLTVLYVLSAIVGIAINLWLIPKYAALGAIASAYLIEISTISGLLYVHASSPRQIPIQPCAYSSSPNDSV